MVEADARDYTKVLPWQVGGVRGKIIAGKRRYDYHGIGPDGIEIAAVWFDTRTGAGLKDAHSVVHAVNNIDRITAERDAALAEVEGLREALEPSGDTKAAYMGEFSFTIMQTEEDEDGDMVERPVNILVPWDAIKQIMASIRARAALSQAKES